MSRAEAPTVPCGTRISLTETDWGQGLEKEEIQCYRIDVCAVYHGHEVATRNTAKRTEEIWKLRRLVICCVNNINEKGLLRLSFFKYPVHKIRAMHITCT